MGACEFSTSQIRVLLSTTCYLNVGFRANHRSPSQSGVEQKAELAMGLQGTCKGFARVPQMGGAGRIWNEESRKGMRDKQLRMLEDGDNTNSRK